MNVWNIFVYLFIQMNINMKQQRKIYQYPLLIPNGEKIDIHLVITEVSRRTGSVLQSYSCPMPEWAQHWEYKECEFYHPIMN